MSVVEIFVNSSQNELVEPLDIVGDPLVIQGICKIGINGNLDQATMRSQYLVDDVWTDIVDAVWSGTDALPAVAYPNLEDHQIRFELVNVGASTSISVTLTYDPARELHMKHAAQLKEKLRENK